SRFRSASRRRIASNTGQNTSIALTPSRRAPPCAARPAISIRKVSAPAFAVITRPPVGSVITAASAVWPLARVPNAPSPPSSSLTTQCTANGLVSLTPARWTARATATLATRPAFMSQAPLPCSTSPLMRAENGSLPSHLARSPTGTTSTCPCSASAGTPSPPVTPTTPYPSTRGASVPGNPSRCLRSSRSSFHTSTSMPDSVSRRAKRCCSSDSASVPVMLGTATVSASRFTASAGSMAFRTLVSTSRMRTLSHSGNATYHLPALRPAPGTRRVAARKGLATGRVALRPVRAPPGGKHQGRRSAPPEGNGGAAQGSPPSRTGPTAGDHLRDPPGSPPHHPSAPYGHGEGSGGAPRRGSPCTWQRRYENPSKGQRPAAGSGSAGTRCARGGDAAPDSGREPDGRAGRHRRPDGAGGAGTAGCAGGRLQRHARP